MIPSFSPQFLHLQLLVKELTSELSTQNIYCCSCVYYTSGFHRLIFWTVLDKKSNRWIGLWAPDLQHHVAAHWSKYRNLLHADCGLARIYNTARSFEHETLISEPPPPKKTNIHTVYPIVCNPILARPGLNPQILKRETQTLVLCACLLQAVVVLHLNWLENATVSQNRWRNHSAPICLSLCVLHKTELCCTDQLQIKAKKSDDPAWVSEGGFCNSCREHNPHHHELLLTPLMFTPTSSNCSQVCQPKF